MITTTCVCTAVLSAAFVSQVDHANTLHATSQALQVLHGHWPALVCWHRVYWSRFLGTQYQWPVWQFLWTCSATRLNCHHLTWRRLSKSSAAHLRWCAYYQLRCVILLWLLAVLTVNCCSESLTRRLRTRCLRTLHLRSHALCVLHVTRQWYVVQAWIWIAHMPNSRHQHRTFHQSISCIFLLTKSSKVTTVTCASRASNAMGQ